MGNYNLNTAYSNFNASSVPYKTQNDKQVSNPITPNELEQQRELASKECAYATKATAMAQILTGNDFKYTTSPEEYVNKLIKQGKIPDKDFKVDNTLLNDGSPTWSITEFNSEGKKVKKAHFCRYNNHLNSWNSLSYYNPKYDCPYKTIHYSQNGGVDLWNYDVINEKSNDAYFYRPDGSLEYYRDYKNDKGMHISKAGKKTEFSMRDKDGNFVKPCYDDDGNLISENY